MPSVKKLPDVQQVVARIRRNMRRWGISVSFLARQLDVTRQYAWQIVHYRTPLSVGRALEIEQVIDGIIAQRMHLQTFGDRLRAARVSAGLTLKEAANMIGYTWVGVERWEKNVCRPKPGVLWHLCSVYGIPIVPLTARGSDVAALSPAPGMHVGIRAELAASLASGSLEGSTSGKIVPHASPTIRSRTQAA